MLVVDSDMTVRMLVTDVFTQHGHRTLQAGDGPSALAIVHSEAWIELIVADVALPSEMIGRQMADAERDSRPEITVLFTA